MIVEVFKTNVQDEHDAQMLIHQLQATFPGYQVNFDLADCDKILRVKSYSGFIRHVEVVNLIKNFGFWAEVLSDDKPVQALGRPTFLD